MITFVMRVHNEAGTLRDSIKSLLQIRIPIEIVVVLHRCTDASKEIALACQAAAPWRHRMVIHEYAKPTSRDGLETFITPDESPHSFTFYTNFAFSLATNAWTFRWDGDFIATQPFVRWIEEYPWTKAVPTVIDVKYRVIGHNGAVGSEAYLLNCLLKYVKSNFWEVASFPLEAVREVAPPDTEFLHASMLDDVKPYWRSPPWFASEDQPTPTQAAEAAELRRRYARAVELVGPEPLGCARALNPAADEYMQRCIAARDQIFALIP